MSPTMSDRIPDPIRVGDRWVFPGGKTLPVVSGASDTGPAPAPTPSPAGAPASAPGTEGASGPGVPPPLDPTATTQQFDAEYVAKLRNEAASWRTRAQALNNIDGGYVEAIDPLLQAMRQGDQQSIESWIEYQYQQLQEARGANQQPQRQQNPRPRDFAGRFAANDDGTGSDPARPLTADDLARLLDERDQRQAQARIQAANQERLNAEFRAIGVEPNSPLGAAVASQARVIYEQTGVWPAPKDAHAALLADFQRHGIAVAAQPSNQAPPPTTPAAPGGTTGGNPDPTAGMTPAQKAQYRFDRMAAELAGKSL